MTSTPVHSETVIVEKVEIRLNQASGFRGKPAMTIDGSALNTLAVKPSMAKKVESA